MSLSALLEWDGEPVSGQEDKDAHIDPSEAFYGVEERRYNEAGKVVDEGDLRRAVFCVSIALDGFVA
jgi:hypothetical protein